MRSVSDYFTYTLEPAAPASFQPIVMRVTSPNECVRLTFQTVLDVAAKEVRITTGFNDGIPPECPPEQISPVFVPIGALPRGTYQVTYIACTGNAHPSIPPCETFGVEELIVGGGDPAPVPAYGVEGAVLLAAAIAIFAYRARPTFAWRRWRRTSAPPSN